MVLLAASFEDDDVREIPEGVGCGINELEVRLGKA